MSYLVTAADLTWTTSSAQAALLSRVGGHGQVRADGLEGFRNYTFQAAMAMWGAQGAVEVSALNGVGLGPAAEITVQTSEVTLRRA